MKTVRFNDLPPGAQVRGSLYLDPSMEYGSGDVLEVELPTGFTIDVGWDEGVPEAPFRIVVYREYFGDRFVDFFVQDVDDVEYEVRRLARELSRPFTVSSCAGESFERRDRGAAAMSTACSAAVRPPLMMSDC